MDTNLSSSSAPELANSTLLRRMCRAANMLLPDEKGDPSFGMCMPPLPHQVQVIPAHQAAGSADLLGGRLACRLRLELYMCVACDLLGRLLPAQDLCGALRHLIEPVHDAGK